MNSYDPIAHSYSIGGVKVPSVSEVISPLSDFSGVHPAIMKAACSFGSNVHTTIELYLNGELDEENLDPHLGNVLTQFQLWNSGKNLGYNPNWIVEKQCYHPGLRYAGTPDIVLRGEAIIDLKTRKTTPVRDILQLTAYEAFYGQPGSHRLIVLELYEDRYVEVDLSKHKLRKGAWGMFRYLLDDWHHRAEVEVKINGWKNKGR